MSFALVYSYNHVISVHCLVMSCYYCLKSCYDCLMSCYCCLKSCYDCLMSCQVCLIFLFGQILILIFVSYKSINMMHIGMISGEINICHMNPFLLQSLPITYFCQNFLINTYDMTLSTNTTFILTFILCDSFIQIHCTCISIT